jgi:hypothetical protein
VIRYVDVRVCARKALSSGNDNAPLLYIMYVRLSYGKTFMTVVNILNIALVLDILNIFTVITCYRSCCIRKYCIHIFCYIIM